MNFEGSLNNFNRLKSDSNLSRSKDNLLYCWGKNKDGELSLGHTKSVTTPKPIKGLKNILINYISSGRQHTAVITQDNQIYVCGSSLHGKLGIDDLTMTVINKFQLIPALKSLKVLQVSCGDYHTLCLLQNGEVYAWGGTLHKKLGQKGGRPAQITALIGKNIVSVGCGDFHSVALTDKGEIYSWGGGGSYFNRGQLGHGHLKDVENPELITAFKGKKMRKFSCGGYHTMALTDNDDIYSWGSGNYGECGFGEFVDSSLPRKVTIDYNQKGISFSDNQKQNIRDIACGGHHSLILTSQGYVYSCGYGSHGQLGLKSTTNQSEPQLIYSLTNKHIIQITVGWNHSLVLTDKLDLYATGYGSSGQLGLGDDESKTVFTHVNSLGGKNIKMIFAGGNHSWVILDELNPFNDNYSPPSPLKEIDEQSKGEEFNIKDNSINMNPIGLEIHYCELDMFHRFIRFKIEDFYKENIDKKIEEYLLELKDLDQFSSLKYNNFKKDEEIVVEITEDNKVTSSQKQPNDSKSFCLMMICEPQYNPIEEDKEESQYFKNKISETPIGEKLFLKEEDIEKNKKEKNLGIWVLYFLKKFRSVCNNMVFMELRPNNFLLN